MWHLEALGSWKVGLQKNFQQTKLESSFDRVKDEDSLNWPDSFSVVLSVCYTDCTHLATLAQNNNINILTKG